MWTMWCEEHTLQFRIRAWWIRHLRLGWEWGGKSCHQVLHADIPWMHSTIPMGMAPDSRCQGCLSCDDTQIASNGHGLQIPGAVPPQGDVDIRCCRQGQRRRQAVGRWKARGFKSMAFVEDWCSWRMHSVCYRREAVAITRSKFEVSGRRDGNWCSLQNTAMQEDLREQNCESMSAILSTRAIAMRILVGLPMQMTFLLTSYEQGWPGGVL